MQPAASVPSNGGGALGATPHLGFPGALRLVLFFLTFLAAAGFSKMMQASGSGITIWPASGVFLATLIATGRRQWPWWLLAALAAELTANGLWFGNPLWLAIVLNIANAGEAVIGALLIHRLCPRPLRVDRLRDVLLMAFLGAGVAPLFSAFFGGTVLAATKGYAFSQSWLLWWIGDATGALIVAPLLLATVHRWTARTALSWMRIAEFCAMAILLVAIALLALGTYLPFAYIIMPPLLWVAVRFDFRGAALALGVLALMTASFAATGRGQFFSTDTDPTRRQVMLQLFLGISAVSALVVAAVSRQHQQAMQRLVAANDDLERRVAERSANLRESEGRLRLFIQNAPAAIAMLDANLRYIAASRRWLTDYNLGEGDITGLRDEEVFPDLPAAYKRANLRALAGESLQSDGDCFRRADGSEIWIKWEVLPWRTAGGEVGGILIATENITEHKRIELALQEADRRKDEFLATLAHELRNPLAPMRNAVRILHLKGSDDADAQWARDVIDRQVQAMSRLIDDLMDISRINRGKIRLHTQRIELGSVVQSAIETSRPLIDEMRHDLAVHLPHGPICVDGDPTRLSQVVLNLLNNAAKYTERGGRIELRVERMEDHAVISVTDNGIGIPASKLSTLFEMFSQVDSAITRAQGGLGIGLCLVKRLVELHGGTVSVSSDGPGKGSTFRVELPAVEHPADAPVDSCLPVSQAGTQSRVRILVVDDNEDSASSLAMLLKLFGHELRTANDGYAALDTAAEFRPNLMLCDIGLPEISGYDVCARIRQETWGRDIRMVAITGWGQDTDRRKSEQAGFNHHLVKPVDTDALLGILEAVGTPHASVLDRTSAPTS